MAKKTYNETPETLLTAILAMQDKIIEQLGEFESAELAIEVKMGDDRYIMRANPLVQEFRALVKDYSNALKAYKEISGASEPQGNSRIEELRARLKVVV